MEVSKEEIRCSRRLERVVELLILPDLLIVDDLLLMLHLVLSLDLELELLELLVLVVTAVGGHQQSMFFERKVYDHSLDHEHDQFVDEVGDY